MIRILIRTVAVLTVISVANSKPLSSSSSRATCDLMECRAEPECLTNEECEISTCTWDPEKPECSTCEWDYGCFEECGEGRHWWRCCPVPGNGLLAGSEQC